MKRFFLLLIVLSFFVSLYSELVNFSEFDNAVFSVKDAIVFKDDQIFCTFIEDIYPYEEYSVFRVVVGKSSIDELDWEFTYIDSFVNFDQGPKILLTEDNSVIVYYVKLSDILYVPSLYCAKNSGSDDNFDISVAVDEFSGKFHVLSNENRVKILINKDIKPFSSYQYFSTTENSVNSSSWNDYMHFNGYDYFNGPVHSNSDIYLHQVGPSGNDGWPIFHDLVTTSGSFKRYPTGDDISQEILDQVFLGGYQEEVPEIVLPTKADEIRIYGERPFDNSADIVYVKIDGNVYTSKYCRFIFTGIDTFIVYNSYPDAAHPDYPIGDSIWVNRVPIYEKQWEDGPSGYLMNSSVFCESKLWIEGVVSGKQTWGCADTIYITDDITYAGTTPGCSPDDPDCLNVNDYFGLISEKSIIVKYKHRDPDNFDEIHDPNCNDIMLYGAYAALGKGDEDLYGNMACHYDGVFTFEYQHPHGATPDFVWNNPETGEDTLLTYVDFHKYIYPASPLLPTSLEPFVLHSNSPAEGYGMCGFPYESPNYPDPNIPPYGTDYPRYNPVWPESQNDIVCERGTLHLFGSLTQRRRGFLHRSGSDNYNHPHDYPNEWDMDEFHYGGTHPSTGYEKDFHYDSRLNYDSPLYFPGISNETTVKIYESTDSGATYNEVTVSENLDYITDVIALNLDENVAIASLKKELNTYEEQNIISFSNDFGETFNEYSASEYFGIPYTIQMDNNSNVYSISYSYDEMFDLCNLLILNQENDILDYQLGAPGSKVDITYSENQNKIIVIDKSLNNIAFGEYNIDEGYSNIGSETDDFQFDEIKFISSYLDQNDYMYLVISGQNSDQLEPVVFIARYYLNNFTPISEQNIISPELSLNVYPNPFNFSKKNRDECNISFECKLNCDAKLNLELYNIKGQKVKVLFSGFVEKGNQLITWDGSNRSGKRVPSGIYFYKMKINDNVEKIDKIMVLK